ncbi:MAG: tryptophanyl-tRNA synthetase [Gammaproteobacteria bacterium]|nr:tryptophanyl-tRNA synthetase [Gammaproteobacteria bacterium]
MTISSKKQRVLSGMRPTGRLHLGHYHGVLKNWLHLQNDHDCYFCIVDWHALTTHYETVQAINVHVWEVLIDWLAAGLDANKAHIFIQSQVPETAELHLLLSMLTPLGWLERMPTYKEQREKLTDRDLSTYGFLGYPLLQAADILIVKAGVVPVGEDQVVHIELAREIARRFNHLYGKDENFNTIIQQALARLEPKQAEQYSKLRKRYLEKGEPEALQKAQTLLKYQTQLTTVEFEYLEGYLEGKGRIILPEPQALLTEAAKLPGLDGQKMSKSYGNTIMLREAPESVTHKIRTMPTDPARIRRTDPGEPEKCPVWDLHKVYSKPDVKEWVQKGCRSAGIGCLECKQPVIDAINQELQPIRERAQYYEQNPALLQDIVAAGAEAVRTEAKKTMAEVRQVVGINYRGKVD